MLFWIIASLVVLIAIYVFWSEWDDSYGSPFLAGLGVLFIGSIIGGLIFAACSWFIPSSREVVADDTYKLKAIGNSSAIEGRTYFLGGGYVKDKRVLNFISQRDGGAILVEQAEAEDSVIYEGSAEATVRIQHYDLVNGWVSPWPIVGYDKYEFRIPTGSVVESYTLDNK